MGGTVTTKELNIAEIWPIDSGSKPEVNLKPNVFDFTTAYHRLRAEAPKPDNTPLRTRRTKAVENMPVEKTEPAADVLAIATPRVGTEESWVAVELTKGSATLAGMSLGGNEALSKKCRKFAIPSGPATPGGVVRCVSATGERFFGLVKGGPVTLAELLAVVKEADEDEAQWAPLVSKASHNDSFTWHAMTVDPEAAAMPEVGRTV